MIRGSNVATPSVRALNTRRVNASNLETTSKLPETVIVDDGNFDLSCSSDEVTPIQASLDEKIAWSELPFADAESSGYEIEFPENAELPPSYEEHRGVLCMDRTLEFMQRGWIDSNTVRSLRGVSRATRDAFEIPADPSRFAGNAVKAGWGKLCQITKEKNLLEAMAWLERAPTGASGPNRLTDSQRYEFVKLVGTPRSERTLEMFQRSGLVSSDICLVRFEMRGTTGEILKFDIVTDPKPSQAWIDALRDAAKLESITDSTRSVQAEHLRRTIENFVTPACRNADIYGRPHPVFYIDDRPNYPDLGARGRDTLTRSDFVAVNSFLLKIGSDENLGAWLTHGFVHEYHEYFVRETRMSWLDAAGSVPYSFVKYWNFTHSHILKAVSDPHENVSSSLFNAGVDLSHSKIAGGEFTWPSVDRGTVKLGENIIMHGSVIRFDIHSFAGDSMEELVQKVMDAGVVGIDPAECVELRPVSARPQGYRRIELY